MRLLRKDMEEQAFFLEVQRLSMELDRIVDLYNMRDRVASVMVTGLIDEDIMGNSRLKAIYSYSLDSREELNSILQFIDSTWYDLDNKDSEEVDGYKDIDDLLNGTGVELED
jgi:hypothetical protein|tara:strand:- start:16 stop:351 length:336 start_codon:yes stop_codon:yes gene_type:complete